MSGSFGRMANPLGPGMPNPGTTGGAGPGGPPGGPVPAPPMGGSMPGNALAGGGASPPGLPPRSNAPGGGASGLGMMPSGLDGVRKTLEGRHGELKAASDQLGKALSQLDHMRKGLERLADKGDMVTSEDIIHEAGKLVGHGIDPMALAGILAEMPQQGGGEALGGWVMSHAIQAATTEQQVMMAHTMVKSHLAASAVHMITAHDTGAMLAGPEPQEPGDGGNALGASPATPEAGGAPMGGALGMGGPRA